MTENVPTQEAGLVSMAGCSCPDSTLCRTLNRHIHGRLWEIWNGINIDAAKAEAYREHWRRTAAEMPDGVQQARTRCRHRGEEAIELVSCPSCGKDVRGAAQVRIKVFACAVFGKCTEARKLESISGCCTGCTSYEAPAATDQQPTEEIRTV